MQDDINTLEAGALLTVFVCGACALAQFYGIAPPLERVAGGFWAFWAAMILVRIGWIKPQ